LDKDTSQYLGSVLGTNGTIHTASFRDAQIPRDQIILITTCLANNRNNVLKSIDFSGNNLEPKVLASLASSLAAVGRLESLSLSKCGANNLGLAPLFKTMERYSNSLTHLDLSHNKLESSTALGQLLSTSIVLKTLNLSATAVDFSSLRPSHSLTSLDISCNKIGGHKDMKHLEAFKFLSSCPNITKCNLAQTAMSTEISDSLFNSLPSVTNLDLSHSNAAEGVFTAAFNLLSKNRKITHLNLSGNFNNPTKGRRRLIEVFSEVLEREDCQLEYLGLAGNSKGQLRGEIMPIVFALMKNRSIQHVDISGNAGGDGLALGMSKALQVY